MQHLRYSPYLKGIFLLLDLAALWGVLLFYNRERLASSDIDLLIILILSLFWSLLGSRTKIYDVPRILTFTNFFERLLRQVLLFSTGALLLSKIAKDGNLVFGDYRELLAFSIFILWMKSSIFFIIKWLRSLGINNRNIMFVERGGISDMLKGTLAKRRDYGYRIFEFSGGQNLDGLKAFWQENGIHTAYLPLQNTAPDGFVRELLLEAERCNVKIAFIPDNLNDDFVNYGLSYAEAVPILKKEKFPLELWANIFMKRLFDVLLALAFLVFIGVWLFSIISLLIKADSKGPVFFIQKRYGKNRRIFSCLKFRTMVPNSGSDHATTQKDDLRITPIGKFLRRSSLDETPQFINVLLGQMSVVGPRPHMLRVDDHYCGYIGRFRIRNLVKPGITGLAQISGLRGDTEDMDAQMQKRVLADAFYVKNWSLSLDAVIILKTCALLLRGDKKAF